MTALENFQFTDITVPSAGGTFTGAALECLIHCVDRDIQRSDGDQKGDWRPLVFLMTDSTPSDVYAYGEAIKEVKSGRSAPLSPVLSARRLNMNTSSN